MQVFQIKISDLTSLFLQNNKIAGNVFFLVSFILSLASDLS